MLTIIIKRNDIPTVIQLTQYNMARELNEVNNSEMLLEDRWADGLRKVRTDYVCLVEADCTLSSAYIKSNLNLLKKAKNIGSGKNFNGIKGGSHGGGGYTKLAMLSSCLGVRDFGNRIYNYRLEKKDEKLGEYKGETISMKYWSLQPQRQKRDMELYPVQVGFVPGAMIRMSSIKDAIDDLDWDEPNLIKMSTQVSFYLWNTNRHVGVNPNTTYVSNQNYFEHPPVFDFRVPLRVGNIFNQERIQ